CRFCLFFFQAEDGIRDRNVTGVQTCALPICAVISSVLTTIVVFVPIVLMDDEIGKMMIVLTVVVAVTLISSVLIAFTLIPVLSRSEERRVGKAGRRSV